MSSCHHRAYGCCWMTAFADAGDDIRSPLKPAASFLINPVARASHREVNQIHDALCDLLGAARARDFLDRPSLRSESVRLSRKLDCWEGTEMYELTPLADQRSIAVLSMRLDSTHSELVIASLKFWLTSVMSIRFFRRSNIFNGSTRHP